MLNSPVLDTAIGLVFIYLLYSLLATSVKEGIATVFGLRARMLQKGIVKGMFSNTINRKDFHILVAVKETFRSFNLSKIIKDLYHFIIGVKISKEPTTLGDHFYNHPIIKSYGSNERFATPSYIPTENFSTVLIEVLQDYFRQHEQAIKSYVQAHSKQTIDFDKLPTITRISYLLDYLSKVQPAALDSHFIDKDTLDILQLYLKKSGQNLEAFETQLGSWFNETMFRVSGWYKRQSQFILFAIGFAMALVFNVNIIAIAGKLSTDKDARDKLVSMAIKEADALKNDPRVKEKENDLELHQTQKKVYVQNLLAAGNNRKNARNIGIEQVNAQIDKDTIALAALKKEYEQKRDEAQKMLHGDITDANNLLAIGWGDYGLSKNRAVNIARDSACFAMIKKEIRQKDYKTYTTLKQKYTAAAADTALSEKAKQTLHDTLKKYSLVLLDQQKLLDRSYMELYRKKEYRIKAAYFISQVFTFRNFIGYLLLAVGVCLGAPFWFDLLQKMIKLRAAGKKEDNEGSGTAPTSQPIQVNVNNNSTPNAIG